MLEKLNKRKAAIIYSSQSAYSRSLQETFTTNVVGDGGEIVSESDISQANFNPADTLQVAKDSGAEILVFLNDSKTANKAYLLMQLNELNLPILGGDGLYKPQTLQVAGKNAVGLVISVPWHILSKNNNSDFPNAARRLWGGDAVSYTHLTLPTKA